MSVRNCAIGVDFGTESGRVLVLDVSNGEELAVSVVRYASGVIDRELPSTGEPLPPDWALQDPADWVSVIEAGVPDALARSGVDAGDVVGLGVDFTSCTVLPDDRRRQCRCPRSSAGGGTRTRGRSCGSTTQRSRSPTGSTKSRSRGRSRS